MSDPVPHQNEVHLEPESNILVSVYHGDQTESSIRDVTDQAKQLILGLRAEAKPVRIMIDTSDIRTQDSGARKAAIDGIEQLDYDKLAIFGANILIKYVTQFLIQVSSKKTKVRYFDTESEARVWINEV